MSDKIKLIPKDGKLEDSKEFFSIDVKEILKSGYYITLEEYNAKKEKPAKNETPKKGKK